MTHRSSGGAPRKRPSSATVLRASAWALAALAVGLALAILASLLAWAGTPGVGPESPWQVIPVMLFLLASPVVGALIVSRTRQDHPVGWLFIVSSGALAFGFLADMYVTRAVAEGAEPSSVVALRWVANWASVPAFASIPLLALLFPDGKPPSPRWRLVLWSTILGATLLALSEALRPEVIITAAGEQRLVVPNPFAIPALHSLATAAGAMAIALITGSVVLALIALVLRFRRSRGVERQQLKWFVLAMGTLATLLVASSVADAIASQPGASAFDAVSEVLWVLAISSLALLPLGAGMAILRYRLYDIDVLVNRALVYGALSATLLGTYVISVLALTGVVRPITGSSDIAVAGSTLAVLALFQPLRARIQRFVDRRFYRARYDATKTVDRFGARLREQVDLDQLKGELIGVVDETIKPAHASLWLRGRRS